jgi:hypothetical protein
MTTLPLPSPAGKNRKILIQARRRIITAGSAHVSIFRAYAPKGESPYRCVEQFEAIKWPETFS